jgi:pyruvate dehydrogenase E2 component (dihydrolipoamide acetyltransferase)
VHTAEKSGGAEAAVSDQPNGSAAEPAEPTERSKAVATEVTLPQLGESVTEGTITNWLASVGDTVEADQPLFELSSDKIDTEVPAPTSGVLKEIKVDVDETVDVGTVVAIIGEDGEDAGGGAEPAEDEASSEEAEEGEEGDAEEAPAQEQPAQEQAQPDTSGDGGGVTEGALMSPLVRRMAREHGVDVSQLSGSGQGGRITREDVESAISGQEQAGDRTEAKQPSREAPAKAAPATRPDMRTGERERLEDLSRIRQRIAAKMRESLESSAQLTTVQEADMTRIMQLRGRVKDEFKAREGASLSPFAFLCRAAVLALKRHPMVNAQADWEAGKVKLHEYVNLGIAVDTEKGLLVPNVKGADDLTLAALARGIVDAANKARGKGKLEMEDIQGGTFTMTNTGSRGVLIDTPILNYPEVAILGTGAIQQRPVVVSDGTSPAIAIRDMVYLSMTYDHQLIDGADAARFVTDVKEVVETHDWDGEIGY